MLESSSSNHPHPHRIILILIARGPPLRSPPMRDVTPFLAAPLLRYVTSFAAAPFPALQLRESCKNRLQLDLTSDDVHNIFAEFDPDGSGEVSFKEMKDFINPLLRQHKMKEQAAHKKKTLNTAKSALKKVRMAQSIAWPALPPLCPPACLLPASKVTMLALAPPFSLHASASPASCMPACYQPHLVFPPPG